MNNQTIEKLRSMRLGAMARLHQDYVEQNRFEGITCDEYLALLTDHQWEERENGKIERLLKLAAFRQDASMADIRYAPERNLDRNSLPDYLHWISSSERKTSSSAEPRELEKATCHRHLGTRHVCRE